MRFRLSGSGRIPTRGTSGSAGYDVYASDTVQIMPNSRAIVPTGITAEFPPGYMLSVASRSGLAFKHGITAFHGTIDSDYFPGEIKILLFNTSQEPYTVHKDDRIAQLVLSPISTDIPARILSEDRTGGFGSTGN